MGHRKIGCFWQFLNAWNEWQDAKDWAREYHPAWLEIATKARHEDTRKEYKQKILLAYRGYEYV